MPTLHNVMYNYMDCVQIMIGPRVRYCATYKPGQRSFNVFTAKYIHNFKVSVVTETNHEGSKILEIASMNIFLCSRSDSVYLYDSFSFKKKGLLPIKLLKSVDREPNQVLAMQKCQNEQYLAIITGRNLVANQ